MVSEVLPHDFVYPGSDLRLDRDWEKKGYINGKLVDILDFNAVIPKGNDTGPDFARDDTVSLNGFIYDWDDPGISPDLFATQSKGTVARCRHNFRSFGSITINGEYVRPSGIYAYFVRFSMRQNGPDDSKQWEVINPPDFITDNQAGLGVTNLTADLS